MASSQAHEHFTANNKVDHYLSGDATTPKDIGWVDMRDYGEITITVLAAALTGNGVTAFSIIANSASDGGGTDATVKTHAVGSAPDAAGDYLVLSVSAEQIREVETSSTGQLRYVSAKLTTDNASDQIACTYIRSQPRFAASGLTADSVA